VGPKKRFIRIKKLMNNEIKTNWNEIN